MWNRQRLALTGGCQPFLFRHSLLQLFRSHPHDILVLMRIEIVSVGIQILQNDPPRQHIRFPRILRRLPPMELRHDLPRKQLKAVADILMRRFPSLVQQDNLIDMGFLKLPQPPPDRFR